MRGTDLPRSRWSLAGRRRERQGGNTVEQGLAGLFVVQQRFVRP